MNVIHSTLLCWLPYKTDKYINLSLLQSMKGKIIEKRLSDAEAENKASELNKTEDNGYYLAVYY